jgi:MOSC domain-containing protein YiiM
VSGEFELLAVNCGLPKVLGHWHGEPVLSAFDKRPVSAATVMVRSLAIDGDGQADLEVHGGIDKAVYAYPASNWPWWETEMQLACRPGLFGENLTVGNSDEEAVHIGDRFAWGDVVLEVSQPRAPCFKLAMFTKRAGCPHAMTASARCGWYFRVLQEGSAPVCGKLTRVHESGSPTVKQAFAAVFWTAPDLGALRRIHEAQALAAAWRKQVAKRIRSIGG